MTDTLATEEPLEIRVVIESEGRRQAHSVAITMRTPGHDPELAAGFLLTEGIIQCREDVERTSRRLAKEVELPLLRMRSEPTPEERHNTVNVHLRPGVDFGPERLMRNFYITSSCGVCGRASLEALHVQGYPSLASDQPKVSAKVIQQLPQALREAQPVFERTGGLHAAALFDTGGRLVTLREDVGRHNALDKLVGHHLLKGHVPLSNYLVAVSGRASWELMQKALIAGIPILVAVGAPSSLAVQLAQEFGMTLVGFARREGFNIYTNPQRIFT
jgi:FdhD protein